MTGIGAVAAIENFAPDGALLHEITLQLLVARDGNLEAVPRERLLHRLFRADSEPTFGDPFGTIPSVRKVFSQINWTKGQF